MNLPIDMIVDNIEESFFCAQRMDNHGTPTEFQRATAIP